LARSEESARRVAELGAEPVRGDIGDPASLAGAAAGSDVAFHLAAQLGEWGSWAEFERGNVEGTRNALAACAEAGVRRFVHCGTEAALMAGEPLVGVDETAPLRPDSRAPYPATKARAEQQVREANREGFETVALRPRFVWGKGDTTLLPEMVETVEAGKWAWVGGGAQRHRHGPRRQRRRGPAAGGGAGPARPGLLRHRRRAGRLPRVRHRPAGHPGGRTARPEPPAWTAAPLARVAETAWKVLPLRGAPPMTTFRSWLLTQECTIDISKARAELGYEPIVTHEQGLAELAGRAGT
jgi:nucleoside-diphosphate-sugar epimerase